MTKENETLDLMSEDEVFNYLEECLHQGEVRVVFQKKDGSKRTMNCTLLQSYYPDYKFSASGSDNEPTLAHSSVIRVWDIDESAWRSIRRGSIEEVELTKFIPPQADVG